MLARAAASAMLLLGLGGLTTAQPAGGYLFSSFRGDGDGLHLAWSRDGLSWTALNDDRPYLTPTIGGKLLRDPSIVPGPDGTFHMVWTTGWWDRVIGYASSKDLVHWSAQREIPVMAHEPTARNAWAPDLAYDPVTRKFIIVWASTIPGRFPPGETAGDRAPDGVVLNHRLYATHRGLQRVHAGDALLRSRV